MAFAAARVAELAAHAAAQGGGLDIGGAITVTAALMVAVYAIVNGNADGWTSGSTLGRFALAVVLVAAFIAIETRVASPLMPLGLFRRRNRSTASAPTSSGSRTPPRRAGPAERSSSSS